MSQFYRKLFVLVVGVFVLLTSARLVFAQCVDGTITAELQVGGPYNGLWKYTIEMSWISPQGLSNITLDCGFSCDPDAACLQTYMFDDPAGFSDGEPAPCQVDYAGEFNCSGNPAIGITDPIVKWDAVDSGGCEPGNTGSGTYWFYTNIAPTPLEVLAVVLEKNGQNVCSGSVVGDCPLLCPVPVETESWGSVKSRYR